ncbi:hypothetical protein INR49_002831 [Caranx melampygus]|nr:hypothetical protein INR49_002831 [Caranx melampygus]
MFLDVNMLVSVLSVMSTWILCTVVSAPPGAPRDAPPAASSRRLLRTKRCSCATFLDKECVYFCHLDIIWVNTPERVVSYGLGNAPRTKRAAVDSLAASSGARCRCFHEDDDTCRTFCRAEPVHSTRVRDSETQKKHTPTADGDGAKRWEGQVSPPARVAVNAQHVLEEEQRARAPPPKSTSSNDLITTTATAGG